MKLIPILLLLVTAGSMTPPSRTLADLPVPQRVEVVVDRECATGVSMGPKFECRGDDERHLTCTGLVVTFSPKCERLNVVNGKEPHGNF